MKFLFKSCTRRLLADACTPVQLYLHARDHFPEVMLFETAAGQHTAARSFICFGLLASVSIQQGIVSYTMPGVPDDTEAVGERSLQEIITAFTGLFETPDIDVQGINGLHGYIGYDALQYMAGMPQLPAAGTLIPDLQLGFYRYVLCFDHRTQELQLTERYPAQEQPHGFDLFPAFLLKPAMTSAFTVTSAETADCTEADFLDMARQAKAHCYRGDVFQLVLSRSFSMQYKGDDFHVYRRLRSLNPSPYMFCCDYGSFRLMGTSPETQLVVENNTAVLHPIAGTFRRTGNTVTDAALAEALLQDPKENAEHVMLVDLARNDLSRHYDSVTVSRFKEIQEYSHLMHIVSEVKATQPADGYSGIDALCATFPAGTLSGAPRHRALQLISRYEHSQRSYYGGCTGFIGFDGSVNMAIIIRSLLSKDRTLYYRAGAGIVAASDEQKELEEVNHKLRAVRTAIARANERL